MVHAQGVLGVWIAWVASVCLAVQAEEKPAKEPPKFVIVKAEYGDLPDGAKADVTAKIKELAKPDGLTVDATNDNFGDPAEGVLKKLKVEYTLDGQKMARTVNENETLTISTKPSRLVVVKAFYGDLPDGNKTDVTSKVQEMVRDDALSVDATNDNFGDPADGVLKKLKVEYTLDGRKMERTVDENETLTISNKPGKLVVVKAFYGDLPDGNKTDVTAKVQAMVKDDALSVDATNDNFGDPAEGVGKKLKVDYTFEGASKSKEANEGESLTISNKGE